MNTYDIIDSVGKNLRNEIFVVAFVRVEGVNRSSAEYWKLVQEL